LLQPFDRKAGGCFHHLFDPITEDKGTDSISRDFSLRVEIIPAAFRASGKPNHAAQGGAAFLIKPTH